MVISPMIFMNFKKKYVISFLGICVLGLFWAGLSNCDSSRNLEPEEVILAKIGNRSISLHEFISRAEYTISSSARAKIL